jgi:hypothetical protein
MSRSSITRHTDEAFQEPDVKVCNTDERMLGPPYKRKRFIQLSTKTIGRGVKKKVLRNHEFTSNGVGLVCTILLV